MNHQHHQQYRSSPWAPYFPFDKYPEVRPYQADALNIVFGQKKALFELPTGIGKTVIGYTRLKSLTQEDGSLMYIAPTKVIVNQVKTMHPDIEVVYGRHDYTCLYARSKGIEAKADEIPCSLLVKSGKCRHFISSPDDQPPLQPCLYYYDKVRTQQPGKITGCTMAYFLINRVLLGYPEKISGLVIDEAHRMAEVARNIFCYDITDYNLKRLIEFLKEFDDVQADNLQKFLQAMTEIARHKPALTPTLLEFNEIEKLLKKLRGISLDRAREKILSAIKKGHLEPLESQEILNTFELLDRDLRRYVKSFEFSLEEQDRNPLSYIFAYYKKGIISGEEKVRYRLCIRAHYVAPLIKLALKGIPYVLAYSGTIGNPEIFGFETGIQHPFHFLPSPFPPENTRIFLPLDTPNLAFKNRGHLDMFQAMTMIAGAAKVLKAEGCRSLVIVVSEKERNDFLHIAKEHNLEAISYGNGVSAQEAGFSFVNGSGDLLLGTAAHYSEGIDLPKKIAPAIFYLRPGHPNPNDPAAQYELRRFGDSRWKVWNWRALRALLQCRGRNIRSDDDLGVTFLISQQFGRFLPGGLPQWLQLSWVSGKSMDDCIKEALTVLGR